MDKFVAKLNIEHFKKLLATETDEAKRQTLLNLLTAEEDKLAKIVLAAAKKASDK